MFVLIFSGGNLNVLKSKINRICDSFSASKFQVPQSQVELQSKIEETESRLNEVHNVANLTHSHIQDVLDGLIKKSGKVEYIYYKFFNFSI